MRHMLINSSCEQESHTIHFREFSVVSAHHKTKQRVETLQRVTAYGAGCQCSAVGDDSLPQHQTEHSPILCMVYPKVQTVACFMPASCRLCTGIATVTRARSSV